MAHHSDGIFDGVSRKRLADTIKCRRKREFAPQNRRFGNTDLRIPGAYICKLRRVVAGIGALTSGSTVGVDPSLEKQTSGKTFETVARVWFARWKTDRYQRHAHYVIRRLEVVIFPEIGSRWSEFDMDGARWNIPAQRMKMKSLHIVPLSKQAVVLLTTLREISFHRERVFPGDLNPQKPMSNNTILYYLVSAKHSRPCT